MSVTAADAPSNTANATPNQIAYGETDSGTCIVHFGQVEATIEGQLVVAGPSDIIVIKPETPHRYTAIGEEPLVAVCIHASNRFIIDSGRDDLSP